MDGGTSDVSDGGSSGADGGDVIAGSVCWSVVLVTVVEVLLVVELEGETVEIVVVVLLVVDEIGGATDVVGSGCSDGCSVVGGVPCVGCDGSAVVVVVLLLVVGVVSLGRTTVAAVLRIVIVAGDTRKPSSGVTMDVTSRVSPLSKMSSVKACRLKYELSLSSDALCFDSHIKLKLSGSAAL